MDKQLALYISAYPYNFSGRHRVEATKILSQAINDGYSLVRLKPGSVVIDGYQMPFSCRMCKVKENWGFCNFVNDDVEGYLESRHKDCPLIKVKGERYEVYSNE